MYIGDLRRLHGVRGTDGGWIYHTGETHIFFRMFDRNLLFTRNVQIAIGQHFGDRDSDGAAESITTRTIAGAGRFERAAAGYIERCLYGLTGRTRCDLWVCL